MDPIPVPLRIEVRYKIHYAKISRVLFRVKSRRTLSPSLILQSRRYTDMTVTAVGSLALDSLVLPSGEYNDILGGSLSHFCSACSLFDASISMVAVIGKDFPQEHLDYFRSRGINLDLVQVSEGLTFRWKGQYNLGEMEEAITLDTQLNVFESFSPQFKGEGHETRILFLGNIHPALQRDVAARTVAELKVLDTMNLWIESTKQELLETLKLVDVLIFNEGEARALTGETDLMKAGLAVLECGPSHVVIKMGSKGACLVTREFSYQVPAYEVDQVQDPTGAGDSFAGGFIGYLSEQAEITPETLKQAMIYGNILGSMNVEGIGTSILANSSRSDILSRMNQFLERTGEACAE